MIAGVPYDAEVEYLESTGTQWIDTGVKPDNTYTFDTAVAVLNTPYNCIYWGCRSAGTFASDNSQCYLNSFTGSASDILKLYSTNTSSVDNWSSGIVPQVGVMYSFSGITVVSTMNTMTYSVVLFGLNIIGTVNASLGRCRIGKWTAYSNDIKVADFVPVRVGSGANAVGYMYDRVTKRLFGNQGTGAFTIGPDVARPVMGVWRYA